MQNNKLTIGVAVIIMVIVIVVGWFVFSAGTGTNEVIALDGFAQCLTDKGFKMYGAYWCPHCQNEKAKFGESFQYIDYVECTKEPKQCTDAQVKGYPTWTGPDNLRLEGEQGVERLSEISGCTLSPM